MSEREWSMKLEMNTLLDRIDKLERKVTAYQELVKDIRLDRRRLKLELKRCKAGVNEFGFTPAEVELIEEHGYLPEEVM